MVIARPPASATLTVLPSFIALALLNLTVPKLLNVSTPRRPLGASSTHSAEECEDWYCSVVWKLWPVVLFLIERS